MKARFVKRRWSVGARRNRIASKRERGVHDHWRDLAAWLGACAFVKDYCARRTP